MINILIRSHDRPEQFRRCIESIKSQTHKDVHLIVSQDTKEADTIKTLLDSGLSFHLRGIEPTGIPYSWNLYCNILKEQVQDGWFFYLDSDDYLHDKFCLQRISEKLDNPYVGVMCQYKRGPRTKPNTLLIQKGMINPASLKMGKIGGSCIFLHHKQKNIADWKSYRAADYTFIKEVSEKLPLKFVKIVVVQTGNNGLHGR